MEWQETLRNYVVENPGTSMLIAAGVGSGLTAVLGYFLGGFGKTKRRLRTELQEEKDRYNGLLTNYRGLRAETQEEIREVENAYEQRMEIRRSMDHVIPFTDTVQSALVDEREYNQEQLQKRAQFVLQAKQDYERGIPEKRLKMLKADSRSSYYTTLRNAESDAIDAFPFYRSPDLDRLKKLVDDLERVDGRDYRSNRSPQ